MKKLFSTLLPLLCLLYIVAGFFPPKPKPELIDSTAFGKLPVLANGRIKPFDTLARNSLLMIRGKQTFQNEEGKELGAMDWFLGVMMHSDQADLQKIFLIHNPDVLGLFGWEQKKEKYFSFKELSPFLDEVERQSKLANEVESANRSAFQQEVLKLYNRLLLYHRLKNSLHTEDAEHFNQEIALYQKTLSAGAEAFRKKQAGQDFSKEDLDLLGEFNQRYDYLSKVAYFLPIPPPAGDTKLEHWQSVGQSLLDFPQKGQLSEAVGYLAQIDEAYRAQDSELFQKSVEQYRNYLTPLFSTELKKINYEYFFNYFEPFYRCMVLYVLVFILAWISWLKWPEVFGPSARNILMMTYVVHMWGLISRMYLQGRPPVTNLYSSAIFIGWAAVLLGIILEKLYKNGIGNVTASAMGFLTLLIAHHLAGDGDTLEMMRAVLDSNFWLATHVVVVTLGYASTFLAGFLALIYFIRGYFSDSLDEKTAKSLTSMVYGIVCFATLFSFVGTILGGIWADQSWGRFWGWDPKENGALLIVIWNAIILHARWGGYIRQRGLMMMAIFGNIVTSFSWFGVNMLGIGLHSYGFMDSAFKWLISFDISQVVIIILGIMLPLRISEGISHKENKGKTKKASKLSA
jgi:ABC-type transport system involved in cytochrome c biogenesis permease subunit